MEHLVDDVSAWPLVEPLLDRNGGFNGVGFAEKLRLKIGSEEEYEVGFVEKLLGNMGFEEEDAFVEKLRLKTSGFEEKGVVSKMESFLETLHNFTSSMNQEWMFSVLSIQHCI